MKHPAKTFEIYQIIRVEETRHIRFESYERLAKAGLKPDFKNYDKMYEADISMLSGKSTGEKLESAFYTFNMERPEDFKGHSLSVSDVVVLDDTAYYVDSVGFKPLKDFIPLEIQQSRFLNTLPQTLQSISDNATELEAVSDKDRGLMPITAGYNVTVQEPTSPTDIENLIVDMYVGVSDNIL